MNIFAERTMDKKWVSAALFLGVLSAPTLAQAQKPPAPGNRPLVTVGSQTITNRQCFAKETTTVSKDLLRKMVFTSLVSQAAVKAGVMPTESDVNARIRELSVRQPALAQQAANPSVRADLKTDVALNNLRIRNVTVSDAQVAGFYRRNAALFTLPSQVQTTVVVSRSPTDAARAEMLLGQGLTPQVIASIPGLRVAGLNGYRLNMQALSPAVSKRVGQTVLAMKPGQVKTIPTPGGNYLTFKVKSSHGSRLLPLSQVRDDATRQARLQKAVSPQQEMAQLYHANPPKFSDPRYKAFFSDIDSSSHTSPAGMHR